VAAVEQLDLDCPITLLAGENGAGKSTLIEATAQAMGFAAEGGELTRLGELPPVTRPVFDAALQPLLSSTKPHEGYYLRAESFFNIAEFIDSGDRHAPDLSLYGDVPLHEQSHGQSFLSLAEGRFGGQGLYLLDEPEAARTTIASSARAPERYLRAALEIPD
jgi:predicted ATPase